MPRRFSEAIRAACTVQTLRRPDLRPWDDLKGSGFTYYPTGRPDCAGFGVWGRLIESPFRNHDVRRERRRGVLGAFVAQRRQTDAREQLLSLAEQHR